MPSITKSVQLETAIAVKETWHWQSVFLKTMCYNYDTMVSWLENNCKKRSVFHAAMFVFEDKEDALLFALRWA